MSDDNTHRIMIGLENSSVSEPCIDRRIEEFEKDRIIDVPKTIKIVPPKINRAKIMIAIAHTRKWTSHLNFLSLSNSCGLVERIECRLGNLLPRIWLKTLFSLCLTHKMGTGQSRLPRQFIARYASNGDRGQSLGPRICQSNKRALELSSMAAEIRVR